MQEAEKELLGIPGNVLRHHAIDRFKGTALGKDDADILKRDILDPMSGNPGLYLLWCGATYFGWIDIGDRLKVVPNLCKSRLKRLAHVCIDNVKSSVNSIVCTKRC